VVKASERKVLAHEVVSTNKMSISLTCHTFMISEACYRYTPKLSDENEKIAALLLDLSQCQRNWGFGLCFLYLRNVCSGQLILATVLESWYLTSDSFGAKPAL